MPDTAKVRCSDDAALYGDIEFCMGDKSLPGTRNHAYYIPRRDIVTFPRPAASPASLDAVAVIPSTSSFVLAADKKWFRIDLVPNESEPECENQGSYGSKTFLNKITLVLPGTGKKVTGLISQLNNDDVVIIVPMADGKCRLFGSPAYQAELSLKQAYGKTATDATTTTIEVSVTDEFAAPFYEGNIVTAYGTINGATDELVTT
ncbi:MAG: hypothetical protein II826_07765 [Prevotella sp.]|nr:hypothetical protein [Prevotella sp.]